MRRAGLIVAVLIAACDGGRIVIGGSPSELPDLASEPSEDLAVPPADVDLRGAEPIDLRKPNGGDLSGLDLAGNLGVDLATTPGQCPADTVAFATYCMDRYEAPNIEGELPFYYQTAPDGEAWCATKGKRLCTEAEWKSACEGPSGNEYPYGDTYKAHACNDDKTWKAPNWTALGKYPAPEGQAEADRLYQGDPSGSRTMCLTDTGVFDLTGNVAEWVKRSYPHANNYDYVVKGCFWSQCYMDTTPDCNFTNSAHPPGFRSYEFGFRCCMDKP